MLVHKNMSYAILCVEADPRLSGRDALREQRVIVPFLIQPLQSTNFAGS